MLKIKNEFPLIATHFKISNEFITMANSMIMCASNGNSIIPVFSVS